MREGREEERQELERPWVDELEGRVLYFEEGERKGEGGEGKFVE